VLYWRSCSFPVENQPRGPLTVVEICPVPKILQEHGFQWLKVKDKDGNTVKRCLYPDMHEELKHLFSDCVNFYNDTFGSHLFRKAPASRQPPNLR
jgi:hypothetical protein